jgi:hypothetical protein
VANCAIGIKDGCTIRRRFADLTSQQQRDQNSMFH